MNQKNGKNSLGLDSCFEDLDNPIELFKKWFSKAEENEINDPNVVKVNVEEKLKEDNFLIAKDFFRTRKSLSSEKIYHHIGIYAFTNVALTKYVKLKRSKLEIERNLEQMRAMENNLTIKVGLCDSKPLGVDTEQDLIKVRKEMN